MLGEGHPQVANGVAGVVLVGGLGLILQIQIIFLDPLFWKPLIQTITQSAYEVADFQHR